MEKVETTQGQIIKLGILQRLDLVNLLPTQGSFVRMILINDIRKKLILTQKDVEDFKIKDQVKEGKYTTSFFIEKPGDDIRDFSFTDQEIVELKKTLSESLKVTTNLINICKELQVK